MSKRCCVYQIKNLTNGRVYVGSTINFTQRKWRHFYDLKRGVHRSRFMQRDYDKCGRHAFAIEVLEDIAEVDCLIAREQHWLDILNPQYNSAKVAGTVLGTKHSPETVQKNRERNKGFGNGNARLSREDAGEIIGLIGSMSLENISEKFGVARTTVQRVLRRLGVGPLKQKTYSTAVRSVLSTNAKANIAGRNARAVNVLKQGELSATVTPSTMLAASLMGISTSNLAKLLKRSKHVIRGEFCASYDSIQPEAVVWRYRRFA